MTKRMIVLSAAIGPPVFMAVIACISKHIELYTVNTLEVYPRFFWMICKGVFVALYLTLPYNLYPKYDGRSLIWGAGIGILLAVLLGIIGYWGFGIALPFLIKPLTLLSTGGLCITGNILCIIRTWNLQKNTRAS